MLHLPTILPSEGSVLQTKQSQDFQTSLCKKQMNNSGFCLMEGICLGIQTKPQDGKFFQDLKKKCSCLFLWIKNIENLTSISRVDTFTIPIRSRWHDGLHSGMCFDCSEVTKILLVNSIIFKFFFFFNFFIQV